MPPELVEQEGHASLDRRSREQKAEKIQTMVEAERALDGSVLLEIGVGSGVIAARLAEAVGPTGEVWGVDVRDSRVVTDGFRFGLVEGTALPFSDGFFDVVVSNHVLEHVGNRSEQVAHLREVARVLKDDGVAYLATPNRWTLVEPHYHLPLLSWLPRGARGPYVRLTRRGRGYDCEPRSRAELVELCSLAGLDLADRTLEAVRLTGEIENPPAPVRLLTGAPERVLRALLPLMPSHVAILRRSGAGLRG
ncbi:MAG: class I SAM-dependent methyltransferase [Gaiellaceae bacterium]